MANRITTDADINRHVSIVSSGVGVIVRKMSEEAEQQYMETSENGHELDDDFNGAGLVGEGEDGGAENQCDQSGDAEDGSSQNGGNEGGQIDASKGEEDAG